MYAPESDTCLSVMYYRQDEFKKNDIPEDVATWEELAQIGARLHERTGHISSALGGTGFAILKDKPNTAAATELLKQTYLTKEGQLLRFQRVGFLPTLKPLYQDKDFLDTEDATWAGSACSTSTPPPRTTAPSSTRAPTSTCSSRRWAAPSWKRCRARSPPR
ncbi:hypothetical protein [Streptosporangium sp. NPDC002721]|uniref:hypothetical protein n=1 Tax=Streptosporangium sp. NPDC002721 TaxID=3366188 RepID=UPI003684B747